MESLFFGILCDDGLVLVAGSIKELRLKFDKLKNTIEKKGLKINLCKIR